MFNIIEAKSPISSEAMAYILRKQEKAAISASLPDGICDYFAEGCVQNGDRVTLSPESFDLPGLCGKVWWQMPENRCVAELSTEGFQIIDEGFLQGRLSEGSGVNLNEVVLKNLKKFYFGEKSNVMVNVTKEVKEDVNSKEVQEKATNVQIPVDCVKGRENLGGDNVCAYGYDGDLKKWGVYFEEGKYENTAGLCEETGNMGFENGIDCLDAMNGVRYIELNSDGNLVVDGNKIIDRESFLRVYFDNYDFELRQTDVIETEKAQKNLGKVSLFCVGTPLAILVSYLMLQNFKRNSGGRKGNGSVSGEVFVNGYSKVIVNKEGSVVSVDNMKLEEVKLLRKNGVRVIDLDGGNYPKELGVIDGKGDINLLNELANRAHSMTLGRGVIGKAMGHDKGPKHSQWNGTQTTVLIGELTEEMKAAYFTINDSGTRVEAGKETTVIRSGLRDTREIEKSSLFSYPRRIKNLGLEKSKDGSQLYRTGTVETDRLEGLSNKQLIDLKNHFESKNWLLPSEMADLNRLKKMFDEE